MSPTPLLLVALGGCHLFSTAKIDQTCEDLPAGCGSEGDGADGSDGGTDDSADPTDDTGGADGTDGTDGSDGSDGTDGTDTDVDGDGFSVAEGDCDDTEEGIHPGADELCDEALVDEDCDDLVNDDDDAVDKTTWYADNDGDTYGDPATETTSCTVPTNAASNGADCDDSLSAVNPTASEVCGDELDNDCDGSANGCRPLEGAYADIDAGTTIQGGSNVNFGTWLSHADLDQDGRDELLTSDVDLATSSHAYGAVFVYDGLSRGGLLDASTDYTARLTLPSTTPTDTYFGYHVIGTADLSGDVYDDLVVADNQARIFVFDGPLSGTSTTSSAFCRLDDAFPYDSFANAHTSLDFDNDGDADLIVGDSGGGATGAPTVWGVPGPFAPSAADIDSLASLSIAGTSTGMAFGSTVADGGDMDADGVLDLWIADTDGGSATSTPAVYLFSGKLSGSYDDIDANATITGESASTFGFSIGAAGDVNADGYDDVLVGDIQSTAWKGGSARLFLGPLSGALSTRDIDAIFYVGSPETYGYYLGFGTSIEADIDQDGHDDLIIGMPLASSSSVSEIGASLIWYGPAIGAKDITSADAVIQGSVSNQYFSIDLHAAGDYDVDGYPDLALGSYGGTSISLFYGGGL